MARPGGIPEVSYYASQRHALCPPHARRGPAPLSRLLLPPVAPGWLQAQHAAQTPPPPHHYWRLSTPLVVLWWLILQRLQADHTDDAVVSHLHAEWLVARLARCRLPQQPQKVAHEPRKVRRRPQVFPALKGDRALARQQALEQLGYVGEDARAAPIAERAKQPAAVRRAA